MAGKAGNSEPETTDSLRAFGAVVKAFRGRAKLTQEGLARRVGFSAGTVASIEQGRRSRRRSSSNGPSGCWTPSGCCGRWRRSWRGSRD